MNEQTNEVTASAGFNGPEVDAPKIRREVEARDQGHKITQTGVDSDDSAPVKE